jgi:hypothetical protein
MCKRIKTKQIKQMGKQIKVQKTSKTKQMKQMGYIPSKSAKDFKKQSK